MIFSLLLLVIARQAIICLEHARLRREMAVSRAYAQALAELDRRKDEFLGVVSHEIRTPLTSLHGCVQLLATRFNAWWPLPDGAAVPSARAAPSVREVERTHAMFASSEKSLQRLTRLVDDLLDDTRIRDGQLALRRTPCDLCALVRSAVEAQRALEPGRVVLLRGRCSASGDGDPLVVDADADRIAQVVANFLSNALKYSSADRSVEVLVEAQGGSRDGGQARVAVRDGGPGLTEAERARVWERYPNIERVTVQSGSGVSLGLGLSISKSIVERHGGEVGVVSTPGQGSTFWFTLPLPPPTPYASHVPLPRFEREA
jgi:signal transduction histidine kinase